MEDIKLTAIAGTIDRQKLAVRTPHIVSDSINYLSAEFSFESEDWTGHTKYAHFRKGDKVYDVELVDDKIEQDKGLNLTEGYWCLYLHGTKTDDNGNIIQRITTNEVFFKVKASGMLDGLPFPPFKPDKTEEFEARIKSLEAGLSGTDSITEMEFFIDHKTGILCANVPDLYSGPEFRINEKGYLEVTIND